MFGKLLEGAAPFTHSTLIQHVGTESDGSRHWGAHQGTRAQDPELMWGSWRGWGGREVKKINKPENTG